MRIPSGPGNTPRNRNGGSGSNGGNGSGTTASQGSHGDVIIGIDSQDVKTYNDLANYVDTKAPGDTVTLKVVRGGNTITVPVTLDEWTS
jgi:S1-C subfamily serine protease